MAKITVEFDAEGNPQVSVSGHHGPGCKELTAALEKALGKVVSDKLTSEYAHAPQQGVRVGQKG